MEVSYSYRKTEICPFGHDPYYTACIKPRVTTTHSGQFSLFGNVWLINSRLFRRWPLLSCSLHGSHAQKATKTYRFTNAGGSMTPIRILFRNHKRTASPTTEKRIGLLLRTRLVSTLTLTSVVTCSLLSLDGCKGQNFNIGPSGGEIAGIIVGAAVVVGGTTAILIHENHSHHRVKGCVSSGSNGLQIQTDNKQTWLLTGNTPDIQVGDLLKLQGNKVRKPKHSTSEQTFEVEKITKDLGPCKVALTVAAKSE